MSRIVMPLASSQIHGAEPVETTSALVIRGARPAILSRVGVGSRVSAPPRVAFVLEQSLGHVTHSDNLIRLVTPDPRIEAAFAPIDFALGRRWARPPGFGYWTVRAGLRARHALRSLEHDRRFDALFVHTQVAATLMPDVLRRIPSVVSLDATPIQFDALGFYYGHATNGATIERIKWRLNRSCFARADWLVAWSNWAKQGLVDRYEVPPEKIVVIPPGVDCDQWAARERSHDDDAAAPVRILFVGGDFARKGGPDAPRSGAATSGERRRGRARHRDPRRAPERDGNHRSLRPGAEQPGADRPLLERRRLLLADIG